MAVIADVYADLRVLGVEDGISAITGSEIKLLPEPRRHLRDVVLAILAQKLSVSINHGGGVVVEAGHLLLIDLDHNHHTVFSRQALHQPGAGAILEPLPSPRPAGVLARAARPRTIT